MLILPPYYFSTGLWEWRISWWSASLRSSWNMTSNYASIELKKNNLKFLEKFKDNN